MPSTADRNDDAKYSLQQTGPGNSFNSEGQLTTISVGSRNGELLLFFFSRDNLFSEFVVQADYTVESCLMDAQGEPRPQVFRRTQVASAQLPLFLLFVENLTLGKLNASRELGGPKTAKNRFKQQYARARCCLTWELAQRCGSVSMFYCHVTT